MMDRTPTAIKVTLALSLGVGLGVVLGFFIASRRRRRFPLSILAAGQARQLTPKNYNAFHQCLVLAFQTAGGSNVGFVDDEYKMVLVVRNDLKMGKGKMAAQVSFNLSIVVAMVSSLPTSM